ncbi:DNA transformation protein [Enterococcus sp. PF1-24]|uniref:TfoX/Sxy family DNA transformation protein n=1 Tax=unclassified Enterococcus TaxID=2608891 RepID=UPI002476BF3F|nr:MULTISPECIES: TfoX/Sxy family DNA transformation protein [unclassified Enterococcus]MDH6363048.1 DNA transformation protein [Enterococcus sp. PFB1-1]MDH6400142.1 DNA transformation protein [Enterococcus sp. PF1-24]
MTELKEMLNIGAEMQKKLTTVGITSAENLREVGSQQAFMKLKAYYPEVCLVHLYALEGAVANIEFNQLTENKKVELKNFSDSLKF